MLRGNQYAEPDYSNLKPQVDFVMCSESVLGYFRQFIGLMGWMEQKEEPSSLYLRKGQTFGSLQQVPQLTQCPTRFFATGKRQVAVLLSLAVHVFSFFSSTGILYCIGGPIG
jgi:hypothetical protein